MTNIEILNYLKEGFMSDYFVDLHIKDHNVIGFYKTHSVQYTNSSNQKISYLFPVTFSYRNTHLTTTMTFGLVERNFIVPELLESCAYCDGQTLKVVPVANHLYSHLIAHQSHNTLEQNKYGEYLNIKSFACAILGLSQIQFPFLKIVDTNSVIRLNITTRRQNNAS